MSDRFGTMALLHKEIANMSNEQKRHCRIGKVTRKPALVTALDGCIWKPSPQGLWWHLPGYPNFVTGSCNSSNNIAQFGNKVA